jgi:hypothetical protein
MKLNIINNYKTIYYNILTNFYLIFNLFLPLYDNFIISLHNQASKTLYSDIKKVKRIRMIEFLNELESNDKLILDKNNNLLIIEYNYSDYINNNSDSDSESETDNETKNKGVLDEIKRLLNNAKKNI